mmetsp:Transcript_112/g.511  ORF Transcript_112/g.511 Transcript_112/m.511 type:complete len:204 (+) Transcript_112:229-840(+)
MLHHHVVVNKRVIEQDARVRPQRLLHPRVAPRGFVIAHVRDDRTAVAIRGGRRQHDLHDPRFPVFVHVGWVKRGVFVARVDAQGDDVVAVLHGVLTPHERHVVHRPVRVPRLGGELQVEQHALLGRAFPGAADYHEPNLRALAVDHHVRREDDGLGGSQRPRHDQRRRHGQHRPVEPAERGEHEDLSRRGRLGFLPSVHGVRG